MEIKGFQEVSFLDWPGKNCAVIFLNNCNFRCQYCHNGELARGLESQNIPPAYILSKLYDKREWLDGLVISGGEPTLNRLLVEFCRDVKTHIGIQIKLDTNGSNPRLLEMLLAQDLIDKVSMDIKAPFEEEHYKTICSAHVDLQQLEASIALILDRNLDYEFRTTIVPTLLSEEDVLQIACELSCICGTVQEYTLQNFNPAHVLNPALSNLSPYPSTIFRRLRTKILTDYQVLKCNIKGCTD